MTRRTIPTLLASLFLLWIGANSPVRADGADAQCKVAVAKGLEWLAKQQQGDGRWEGRDRQYPVVVTSLAGMALLMEGSTTDKGPYAKHIRKAVDWLMERSQRSGLIGNPNHLNEASRYMFGHGYSLLFLACVYEKEKEGERRKELADVLKRAVEFTAKAQAANGGWHYTSADGGDLDEGAVTVTQMQALRAARKAGIKLPMSVTEKGMGYLKKATTDNGRILYIVANPSSGLGTPALTVAAIVAGCNPGEYNTPLAKKWIACCRREVSLDPEKRRGHDEYPNYYLAQVAHGLGDDGYASLFPESKPEERLTWSKYRKIVFAHLVKTQQHDGRWEPPSIGPVFSTAVYLSILQLDNAQLSIYKR